MNISKHSLSSLKINALLFLFLLGFTVSLKAQSGDTKPDVQQKGKAIMLQTTTLQWQDSLTFDFKLKDFDRSAFRKISARKSGFIRIMNGPKLTAESIRKKLKAQGYNNLSILQGIDLNTIAGISGIKSKNVKDRKVAIFSAPAAPKKDFWKFMADRRTENSTPAFKKPPFKIQTIARSGNKIMVFIKNRGDKLLKGLIVSIDRLPEEWNVHSMEDTVRVLSPGRSTAFTFSLEGGQSPETVGFKLKTAAGLSFYWSARIQLNSAIAAKAKKKQPVYKFGMYSNTPNPFRATTTMNYALPEPMHVTVEIFNILGQRVAMLVKSTQKAGVHHVTWDASEMASGIYFCRIIAEAPDGERFVAKQKMMLIK